MTQPLRECEACNGEGQITRPDGTGGWKQKPCPACDGTGDETCDHDPYDPPLPRCDDAQTRQDVLSK